MIKKSLLLSFLFVILLLTGGVLWCAEKRQMDAETRPVNSEPNSNKVVNVETKKTIRVSDGTVTFSFDVPSSWLVETRNMSEKPMTEVEMREFFKTNRDASDGSLNSDYTNQYSLTQIDSLSFEQLKDLFEKEKETDALGYPDVSISSSYWIYYGDMNGYQVDFYVLSQTEAQRRIEMFSSGKNVNETFINSKRIISLTSKSTGDPGSGSRKLFIYGLGENEDRVLYINKQYYPEGEVQEDFDYLLKTLKFE